MAQFLVVCYLSSGTPKLSGRYCGPVAALLTLAVGAVDGLTAEPSVASPTASKLVRYVIQQENKIHEFPSFRICVESKIQLTPRYVEHLKSAGNDPRPNSSWTTEVVFDASRIRTRYENDWQVALVDVWNGKERKTYNFDKVRQAATYSLASSFINGFNADLGWLQVGPHRFWWSSLSQANLFAATPGEYVLTKEEEFHGRPCYRCDCQRALSRLFIGVEDRRLYGVVQASAPNDEEELALQSRLADKRFAAKDEAEAYVERLSEDERRRFKERCDRERFVLTLPYYELRFDDYHQVAPNFWIPWQMVSETYQLEAGKTYLASEVGSKVVEAEANPPLTDALFEIEIPEGATVRDQPYGMWPPLEYKYKKRFTENEWRAIVAPREKDLAKAREAKATLEQRIGQNAPDFLPSAWLNSEPLAWKNLRGKVVILEFVADWCGACRRHLPTLAELHAVRDRSGILVIGAHAAGSEPTAIKKFVSESAIEYPLYVDADDEKGGLGQVFRWFHFEGIPQSVLVDREGKIAAIGPLEDVLLKARALAEPER